MDKQLRRLDCDYEDTFRNQWEECFWGEQSQSGRIHFLNEMRGQGDAGPKSAVFKTGGEAMRKLLGKQDNQHSAGKSCKGTGCFILPGERQKTRQPTLTLVVLLQIQGQQHRAEGGGNRGSSLLICSKNHPIAKPHGKG